LRGKQFILGKGKEVFVIVSKGKQKRNVAESVKEGLSLSSSAKGCREGEEAQGRNVTKGKEDFLKLIKKRGKGLGKCQPILGEGPLSDVFASPKGGGKKTVGEEGKNDEEEKR